MTHSEPVWSGDKYGFFDISSGSDFPIANPGPEFNAMVGRNTDGMNYLDVVCPEDRDTVAEKLRALIDTDNDFEQQPRMSVSIKHRILLADGASIGVVVLNAGRESTERLRCSVVRIVDDFIGDWGNMYHSNGVLESFAVSMAVLVVKENHLFAVKYANNDFYEMLGWNRVEWKEFFNEYLNDAIYAEDMESFAHEIISLNTAHSECVFETRIIGGDGTVKSYEVRGRYLMQENGDAVVSVVFDDITERKRVRRDLVAKNERFNIIQENSSQVVIDYDTQNDVCIFTGNLERMQPYLSLYGIVPKDNELVVENFFGSQFALGMMSKKDYEHFTDAFAETIITGEGGEYEFRLCFIGQTVGTWCKCIYSAVKSEGDDVVRIVGRIKNIEKQKRLDALIQKRIKTDMLTGLLNKDTAFEEISTFLQQEAEHWQESEKYHALFIIDIDRFRIINEFFGHTYGDDVIREFASDIKSSFRDTDIVGRIGGDEFMVLMKNVTYKFAVKKAGRLCRGLIKNYGVQNKITLTCSIGMAFFAKDALQFDRLYQYADWAMCNAKKNGRCAYSIYDSEAHDDYRRIEELNNRTCVDPPSNTTEIAELDTNLLDIAFSLSTSSDDIYSALEILLRTVGRKYNLSAVSVLCKQYDDNERLETVSRWKSSRNLRPNHRSPMIRGTVNLDIIFKGASLRCVSDIATCNLPPALKSKLKNDGIYAFVLGRLEGRTGENYGYVMFTQFNRTRKWSRREMNTFKYIAKVISVMLVEPYASRTLQFIEKNGEAEYFTEDETQA